MKKTNLLIVALIFVTLSLASCVKNRVCECKSSADPSMNYNTTYSMVSKKQGTADCENLQTAGRIATPDYSCTLK